VPGPARACGQTGAMDETSVDPEPMTQLSRWFDAARGAGETMPEAMAVATATADGFPSVRMVLLRGLDHRGLVFYTDRGSEKGRELTANPFAAALFHWFLPAHRQVRVSGAVEEVDDVESDAYWQSRPPGSGRPGGVASGSGLRLSSCGRRGRTVSTTGSAIARSPEAGRWSGCLPEDRPSP